VLGQRWAISPGSDEVARRLQTWLGCFHSGFSKLCFGAEPVIDIVAVFTTAFLIELICETANLVLEDPLRVSCVIGRRFLLNFCCHGFENPPFGLTIKRGDSGSNLGQEGSALF